MIKRGDKRAQALSTNAIILIILGVVVLVVLILGFTLGWNRIAPWISGNNVDNIAQACASACATSSVYDYCSAERELKDESGPVATTDCATFSVIGEYDKYGIEECPSISCEFPCENIMGRTNRILTVTEQDKNCDDKEDDVTSIAKVEAGQKCCVAKAL